MSIELKKLMRDFNLTSAQCAELLGLANSTFYNLTTGKKPLKPMVLFAVAHLRTVLESPNYQEVLKEREDIDEQIAKLQKRKNDLMANVLERI